jgi:hypothetical protein
VLSLLFPLLEELLHIIRVHDMYRQNKDLARPFQKPFADFAFFRLCSFIVAQSLLLLLAIISLCRRRLLITSLHPVIIIAAEVLADRLFLIHPCHGVALVHLLVGILILAFVLKLSLAIVGFSSLAHNIVFQSFVQLLIYGLLHPYLNFFQP